VAAAPADTNSQISITSSVAVSPSAASVAGATSSAGFTAGGRACAGGAGIGDGVGRGPGHAGGGRSFLHSAATLCDLPVDGAKAGLKRGNTPMIVKECYDGREDRSWQTEPA
jgi:hypothetical protein